MTLRAALTCFLLPLVLSHAPGRASADEGESAFSLGAYFASLSVPDHSPKGAVLGLEYERGITDVLWLRASAGLGGYYERDDEAGVANHRAYSGQGSVGLTYVLDVLKYVPYVHLGVGAVYIAGKEIDEDDKGLRPVVEIGGGLDVLRESYAFGIQARFASFVDDTALFTLGARVSYRWGFF